jgi:hypothetical protein
MDENDFDSQLALKSGPVAGMMLSTGWLVLLLVQPVIWAWVTAILIAMLVGLFTAKFIFGVHNTWKALALAPFLGCCWIGLFFLIIRAVNP